MTILQKEKRIKAKLAAGYKVYIRAPSDTLFYIDSVFEMNGRLVGARQFTTVQHDLTDTHCMYESRKGTTVVMWRDNPWIVCAAQRHHETKEIICGPRHFSPIMRAQMKANGGPKKWRGSEDGFVDQFDKFYNRRQAYKIAAYNGQIRARCGGDKNKLFSEHLW